MTFLTAKLATVSGTTELVKADTLPVGEPIDCYSETNVQINFRKEADEEQEGIFGIDEGTMVWLIINETGADGTIWSRVNLNGTEGYIRSEFLNVPAGETPGT